MTLRTVFVAIMATGLVSFEPLASVAFASTDDTIYAVLDAQDHRRFDDPIFDDALHDRQPRIRALAVLALGRIAAPESVASVAALLNDRQTEVRSKAAFALGLIGGDSAREALMAKLQRIADRQPTVRRELYLALGRIGGDGSIELLLPGLSDRVALVRGGAGQALGLVFMKGDATVIPDARVVTTLTTLAGGRGEAALGAAFALARLKTPLTALQGSAVIAAFEASRDIPARLQLARVLGKLKTDAAFVALATSTTNTNIELRVESIRALAGFAASDRQRELIKARLQDASPQVVVQALLAVQQLAASSVSLSGDVAALVRAGSSPWIRGQALETLALIAPEEARPLVEQTLGVDVSLTPSALLALGTIGDEVALQRLLPFLGASVAVEVSAAAEGASRFSDEMLTRLAKDALRAALARGDLAVVSYVSDIAARALWRDFATDLQMIYAVFTHPDDMEAKVEVLNALAKIGNASHLTFLETALLDSERTVSLAAAGAIEAISGTSVMERVPRASQIRAVTPPLGDLRDASRARVRLTTTKGVMVLAMASSAPFSAYNFVQLSRQGFYDGKMFHRVVPSFVVQGGDPRGDGYGGPGYVIRDEVSTLSHRRGAVGMATAGKDTGGCQFFINHAANLHLDGNYTVLANVIRGYDVLDALEVGDVIIRSDVLSLSDY